MEFKSNKLDVDANFSTKLIPKLPSLPKESYQKPGRSRKKPKRCWFKTSSTPHEKCKVEQSCKISYHLARHIVKIVENRKEK